MEAASASSSEKTEDLCVQSSLPPSKAKSRNSQVEKNRESKVKNSASSREWMSLAMNEFLKFSTVIDN